MKVGFTTVQPVGYLCDAGPGPVLMMPDFIIILMPNMQKDSTIYTTPKSVFSTL